MYIKLSYLLTHFARGFYTAVLRREHGGRVSSNFAQFVLWASYPAITGIIHQKRTRV